MYNPVQPPLFFKFKHALKRNVNVVDIFSRSMVDRIPQDAHISLSTKAGQLVKWRIQVSRKQYMHVLMYIKTFVPLGYPLWSNL